MVKCERQKANGIRLMAFLNWKARPLPERRAFLVVILGQE
jgi:hypothetical protein